MKRVGPEHVTTGLMAMPSLSWPSTGDIHSGSICPLSRKSNKTQSYSAEYSGSHNCGHCTCHWISLSNKCCSLIQDIFSLEFLCLIVLTLVHVTVPSIRKAVMGTGKKEKERGRAAGRERETEREREMNISYLGTNEGHVVFHLFVPYYKCVHWPCFFPFTFHDVFYTGVLGHELWAYSVLRRSFFCLKVSSHMASIIRTFTFEFFTSVVSLVRSSVSLDKPPEAFTPCKALGKSCARRVWNGGKANFGAVQCVLKKKPIK